MKNIRKYILLGITILIGLSNLSAQTFYELTYKDKTGNKYTGVLMYNGDLEASTMRLVKYDKNGDFDDLLTFENMKMSLNESNRNNPYTILTNNDDRSPRFIWYNKNKTRTYVMLSPRDASNPNAWVTCSQFFEKNLRDMNEDYVSKFFDTEEDLYNTILKARKLVLESDKQVKNNLGNGFEIYRYFYEAMYFEKTEDQIDKVLLEREKAFNKDVATSHPQLAARIDKRIASGGQQQVQVASTSASQTAFAANSKIHLMIVANSEVADIGATCKIDMANMLNEVQGIGQALGLPVQQYLVTGADYSKLGVEQMLKSLKPNAEDVVIFLYTGHGFRFHDQRDQYPNMAMVTSDYQDATANYIAVSDIYNAIVKKGARLNIVLSDCCNADLGERRPLNSTTLGSRGNNNFSLDRLKTLFSARGSIISTAAGPGEVSWCDGAGGMFTLSFIQSLRQEISATNGKEVSWEHIIDNTLVAASNRSKSSCQTAQNGLKYVKMVKK